MSQILVVAGPTASGKTGLAIRLAKEYGGEVISADSMQIYQHMNIASAKPTVEEMEGIPHHLLDFVSPFSPFSVADYVKLAKEKIEEITKRGNLPILCGGTGLYISSLVDNIEFTEAETDFSVRNRLIQEAEEKGIVPLYERLQGIDPEAAEKIHPNNQKRVIRALEIFETTGLTLSQQNARSRLNPPSFTAYMLALCPPREVLYQRIDMRVDAMERQGLFEETKALQAMGLQRDMQSMQGIGYKEAFDYLAGKVSREECLEEIKKATRHYAKRQLTWFRRDKRYIWVDPTDEKNVTTAMEAFTWKNP
ncbi:MAG: tRNA (adenosine(37)-N6)-dimethylallyltransferase MiaA [Clostridia bacterium]|nr:tRNA (adenosine(37)-N6)-dimethylallyltransferase MiaA [Clostridia bacterium]